MKLTKENFKDVYRSTQCDVETMRLKGYDLIKEFFVDSSGFGADDEPALTVTQFERDLLNEIEDSGGVVYSSITRAGQFQVYVGIFKRSGVKRSRRVSNNCLEILDESGKVDSVRLWDTNIIKYDHDFIILSSGGWQTVITKKYINKYLPKNVHLFQKDYEWVIKDDRDNTTKKFVDGMKIIS